MPLSFYDEIELEDMEFDEAKQVFHYPCPCGDRFEITPAQLRDEEDIARCPSCTLIILSLIHISEPTRPLYTPRMPSSA